MSGAAGANELSRKGLADEIDALDAEIKALNESKSDAYRSYREQLEATGMEPRRAAAELAATKAAIARRRKLKADPEAVHEKDALIDDILAEIMPPSRARERTAEEIIPGSNKSGLNSAKSAPKEITVPAPETTAADGAAPDVPQADGAAPQVTQEGSEPTEAHNLGGAGSTPAPATGSHAADHGGAATPLAGVGGEEDRQPIQEPPAMGNSDPRGSGAAPRKDAGAEAPEPFKTDAQRALEIARARLEAKAIAEGVKDGPDQVPRPEGCQHTEACHSSTWRKRCHTCERDWIDTHPDARAA